MENDIDPLKKGVIHPKAIYVTAYVTAHPLGLKRIFYSQNQDSWRLSSLTARQRADSLLSLKSLFLGIENPLKTKGEGTSCP